jgi:carboxyl-terminal processing protease
MRRTVLPFLLVFLVFGLSTMGGALCTMSAWAAGREVYAAWDTLARALHEIQTRYVEPVDEQVLVHAALRGVADSLDPHSRFFDPAEWKAVQEAEAAAFAGIGIRVEPDPAGLRVSEVLPGSPAEGGGIRVGDRLEAVDGLPLAGMPFDDARDRLAGPRGQPVRLGVRRPSGATEVSLVRDLVHEPAAWADLLPGGLGYVAMVHFQEGSAAEFDAALARLQARAGRPLAGLVLDLRGNPGGLLDEAVRVTDRFVADVPIVETRGRDPHENAVLEGTASATDLDLPLAILVDGGSASASEIVAGALRARGRATLVGTPTWGKGSVQTVWTFDDGSALKVTVARYILPDGSSIDHRTGLIPDVVVPRVEEERFDAVLSDLRGRVQTSEGLAPADRDRLAAALEAAADRAPDRVHRSVFGVPVADRLPGDAALGRAIDLLVAGR